MSAPIPEKDKTPLMLLEDRVAALEGNAQANEAVLLNWVKRSIAMEDRVRRLEFVIRQEFRGYDLLCKTPPRESLATNDPQEPYVLDTKPR